MACTGAEEETRARARGADDVRLGRSDARAKRAERGCAILSRRRRLGDERAKRGCGAIISRRTDHSRILCCATAEEAAEEGEAEEDACAAGAVAAANI